MNVQTIRKNRWKRYVRESWQLYTLLLPAVMLTVIFCYWPMYGAQIAFRNYKIKLGIWGSEWVGLKYFIQFVTGNNFWQLLKNTLGLNFYELVVGFPAPILLAFMLNEIRRQKFKKTVQMITYAPHFISTVAVCGLITLFVEREAGIINLIIELFGGTKKDFLADPDCFKTIYVISDVWKGLGWGTIIYLATLSSVDAEIVEAAYIDGASRMQKIIYIDFPCLLPTIIILLVLRAGSMMSVGYEKILLLQNALNMRSSDVISTYVYRLGIENAQYSLTTAIGLFNSVVNVILLTLVNFLAKQMSSISLW